MHLHSLNHFPLPLLCIAFADMMLKPHCVLGVLSWLWLSSDNHLLLVSTSPLGVDTAGQYKGSLYSLSIFRLAHIPSLHLGFDFSGEC